MSDSFTDTRVLFKGLFPKAEITDELAGVYRQVLSPLDQDTLQQALRNLVATTSNWTPRIPQIMAAYEEERVRRTPPRRDDWEQKSEQLRKWDEEARRDNRIMLDELGRLPLEYLRSLEIYLEADRRGPLNTWSRMAVGMTWAAHRALMPV
jgi:hypothetical protein